MRSALQTVLALVGLGAGVWMGVSGGGPVPPLGPLLDPLHGAWAMAATVELPADAAASIPALSAPVDIRYDRRGVPHIFATTEEDAIRALGFVVARDRLFQLEAQTRAASGRITEWAGAQAISLDRQMRRLGLPAAAERHYASFEPGSRATRILTAYAEGVNAWIDGLRPRDVPIEYRLLGKQPERWEPVNSLHLFGRMGWTLASSAPERTRAAAAAVVGQVAADALFPPHSPIVEPIQPNGSGAPRFDFPTLPPPGAPEPGASAIAMDLGPPPTPDEPPTAHASNNWAVSPGRAAAGRALLAGDPHLDMTLPSLWYEAHLVVPGELDVYGVTIPGAPGIVIGFTRDLAWSLTNTGADVTDFYRETVDDGANPSQYQVDGEWRPIERRIERYFGNAGELVAVDTVLFTHRGPMRRSGADWLSMRWIVLESDLDPLVFLDAARAPTTRAFLDTMARGYGAPAQNMIVADRHGGIAIRSTGHFPIRPDGRNGLDILDGSTSASDWTGFWPLERYPQVFDPPQGFVASANQEPKDPHLDPGYLAMDGNFDPWRALQINRLLRADSAVTADAMRRYQTDPGSFRADAYVPYLVAAAHRVAARAGDSSGTLEDAAQRLEGWDRRYTRETEGAVLFEATMRQLTVRTWDELAPEGRLVAVPSSATTLGLMRDSTSPWWDVRSTATVEHRDDVLAASLVAAHDSLVRRFGPPGDAWRWERTGTTRIDHFLGIGAFSIHDIAVQGGPATLNPASAGGHGPSWRMVVELGDPVRAWGTYPGGQSGNPASPRYADRLPLWREGELDTLVVPHDTSALAPSATRARLRLVPGRAP